MAEGEGGGGGKSQKIGTRAGKKHERTGALEAVKEKRVDCGTCGPF